jgi:hypothetical protein
MKTETLETLNGIDKKAILWIERGTFRVRLVSKRSGVALHWDTYDTLDDARARLQEWEIDPVKVETAQAVAGYLPA